MQILQEKLSKPVRDVAKAVMAAVEDDVEKLPNVCVKKLDPKAVEYIKKKATDIRQKFYNAAFAATIPKGDEKGKDEKGKHEEDEGEEGEE